MLIGNEDRHLEVNVIDACPSSSSTPGDVRVRATLCVDGFRGELEHVWLERRRSEEFLASLRRIEPARQGVATLTSMSEELLLHVRLTGPSNPIEIVAELKHRDALGVERELRGKFEVDQDHFLRVIADAETELIPPA